MGVRKRLFGHQVKQTIMKLVLLVPFIPLFLGGLAFFRVQLPIIAFPTWKNLKQ